MLELILYSTPPSDDHMRVIGSAPAEVVEASSV